jgi:stage V sporulation protein G
MKPIESFVNLLAIYKDAEYSGSNPAHGLSSVFVDAVAAALAPREYTVCSPGYETGAHMWSFHCRITGFPGLSAGQAAVYGIDYVREDGTATAWAYVDDSGAQAEGSYTSGDSPEDPAATIEAAIAGLKESASNTRLRVTNVQVYPFKEGPSMGHMRALASVVLNDQFLVRGLRVMEGEQGLFVGYPVDPFFKGEDIRSVCFPMTRALREHIESVVLERYNELK